jgi:hypothetical protein
MWYEYNNLCEVYMVWAHASSYGIYGYVYKEWSSMDRSYSTSSSRFK